MARSKLSLRRRTAATLLQQVSTVYDVLFGWLRFAAQAHHSGLTGAA
jgi:hypothetical protein